MLKDYNVDNFSGKRELALLCMRQSIWNRRVRDYLMPDAYYRTYESFEEMTGGKHSLTVETTHRILNSSSHGDSAILARVGFLVNNLDGGAFY